MHRLLVKTLVFGLFAALPMTAQQPAPSTAQAAPAAAKPKAHPMGRKRAHAARKPAAAPEMQPATVVPPPPPPTPEQQPAMPPQVSYLNGQLTIQSQNSTLGDILSAVRRVTGAQVEAPAGFGGERVATRLGPGPAREVVTALLQGSKFGYIVMASPQDPNGVQRILLTGAQSGPAGGASTSAAANVPRSAPMPVRVSPDVTPDEDEAPTAEMPPPPPAASEPPPGVAPGQPGIPGQPGVAGPGQNGMPQGAPGQPIYPGFQGNPADQQLQQNNPNQPKSPEQLLQELQRLRIQRMQQQQQNGQPAPPQNEQQNPPPPQ
jgi:hypothetical protein